MGLKVRTYEEIDNERQLEGQELTYETLRFGTGTFRYQTAGRDRHGYKKYTYRNGVETVVGDIERSLWQKLIYRLIGQHNEMALFNHLKVWYAKNIYFLRNKAELEQYTLECFSNRIFDNPEWVDYIAFNEKYRPEILEKANLVWVKNECCNKLHRVTKERLERDKNTVYCAFCGRGTKYEILKDRK